MKFQKSLLIIFFIAAAFLLIGIFFDSKIAFFLADHRVIFLNVFMIWTSYSGTWLMVLFIMTSLFLWNEKKRFWILPLWLSLGLTALITYGVKLIFIRERPFEVLQITPLVEAHRSSFPSGHAAAVFSPLAVLDKEFPRFKWFWLLFSLLVAFSRLYLGVHYLSDVVVGSMLGFTIGLFVVYLWDQRKKMFDYTS